MAGTKGIHGIKIQGQFMVVGMTVTWQELEMFAIAVAALLSRLCTGYIVAGVADIITEMLIFRFFLFKTKCLTGSKR